MIKSRHLFSLCLAVLFSTSASAEEFDIDSLQGRIFSTIRSVEPAVVSIGQRGGTFSGVIVSKQGHILSAGHAVRPGGRYQVFLPDGRQLSARGKGSNPREDCALLKITTKVDDLPFVPMGDSKSLVRNQPCLSISFPGGQRASRVPLVRFGRVVNPGQGRGMLQSTALMEPGDSGGALFDLQGRVIGIHSRIGQSMSRNFEVPIDSFKKFWSELNREKSFTQSGPPVPKLGFMGTNQPDGSGINISEIVSDSLAEKHGFLPKDVIHNVYDKETPSIQQLRQALVAARDDDANEIVVKLRREEKELEITVPFDVEREAAPKVELPIYDAKEFPKPQGIVQLANLPDEFSALESKLDDACVQITSDLSDGESLVIIGTLIKGTPFIVSKNSMVKQNAVASFGDSVTKLEVVTRDDENDLVLLKTSTNNPTGIDMDAVGEPPSVGSFLITPEMGDDPGLVSVVSSPAFASRKQQSRGFLGVMPADFEDKGGAILKEVTKDGAADRAGLKAGDVVTKLNRTAITTHMDMRRFLGTVDPNSVVVATISRGEEQIEKTIRLGAFPSFSNHAADRMEKSGRRDGFSEVVSHDADLKPANCGGPLFDIHGNFVGLNIARNSRVRSYAIPPAVVKELLDRE